MSKTVVQTPPALDELAPSVSTAFFEKNTPLETGPNHELDPYLKVSRSKQHWQNEVEVLNRLQNNPDVVRLLGVDKGRRAIYLENIPGRNLDDVLDEVNTVRPERAANFINNAAGILLSLHKQGYAHGDVSLRNFILPDNNPNYHPDRIRGIDFELAHSVHETAPRQPVKVNPHDGTALYLAPEKLSGLLEFGQQSDIFALGVMWYRMVQGGFPFDPCMGNLERQIIFCEPPLPTKADADSSEMIMRCLNKSPLSRPTASELWNWRP